MKKYTSLFTFSFSFFTKSTFHFLFFIFHFSLLTFHLSAQTVGKSDDGAFYILMPDGSYNDYDAKNKEHKKLMTAYEKKLKATEEKTKISEGKKDKNKEQDDEKASKKATIIAESYEAINKEKVFGAAADNAIRGRVKAEYDWKKFIANNTDKSKSRDAERLENWYKEQKEVEKNALSEFKKAVKESDKARRTLYKNGESVLQLSHYQLIEVEKIEIKPSAQTDNVVLQEKKKEEEKKKTRDTEIVAATKQKAKKEDEDKQKILDKDKEKQKKEEKELAEKKKKEEKKNAAEKDKLAEAKKKKEKISKEIKEQDNSDEQPKEDKKLTEKKKKEEEKKAAEEQKLAEAKKKKEKISKEIKEQDNNDEQPKEEKKLAEKKKKEEEKNKIELDEKLAEAKKKVEKEKTKTEEKTPKKKVEEPFLTEKKALKLKSEDNVIMNPPYPECEIAFNGLDEFTNIKRIETSKQNLFKFTDEVMLKYYEKNDFLTCQVSASRSDKGYKYLNFFFTFNSDNVQNTYGVLEKDQVITLRFLDGETMPMFNSKTDRGFVDGMKKTTTYKAIVLINANQEKKLFNGEIDQIRVLWGTGTDDYAVYDLDFFANILNCVK